jgi:hypothetical protein
MLVSLLLSQMRALPHLGSDTVTVATAVGANEPISVDRLAQPRLADGARRYYACGAARSAVAYGDRSCRARAIPAEWLEAVAAEVAGDGRPTRIRIDQTQPEGRDVALVTIDAPGRRATRAYRYSARRRASGTAT